MSDHYLFPRLGAAVALAQLREITGKSHLQLAGLASTRHRDAVYAATGGSRVPEAVLEMLRERMLVAANGFGYPRELRRETGAFDASAARLLFELLPISPGEASRDDVWAFITLVLLPDLAAWRFSTEKESRLLGGVRNTFQRLWWRAHILRDPDAANPFWLVALPEDALVGLMERPALSSNRDVAIAIARSVAVLNKSLPSQREEAWRDLYKRIRQRLVVLNFEMLAQCCPGALNAEIAELLSSTRRRSARNSH